MIHTIRWLYYIHRYDSFMFDYSHDGNSYFKHISDDIIAIVWANGLCSIHKNDGRCILSTGYFLLSKKMANKLLTNHLIKEST